MALTRPSWIRLRLRRAPLPDQRSSRWSNRGGRGDETSDRAARSDTKRNENDLVGWRLFGVESLLRAGTEVVPGPTRHRRRAAEKAVTSRWVAMGAHGLPRPTYQHQVAVGVGPPSAGSTAPDAMAPILHAAVVPILSYRDGVAVEVAGAWRLAFATLRCGHHVRDTSRTTRMACLRVPGSFFFSFIYNRFFISTRYGGLQR